MKRTDKRFDLKKYIAKENAKNSDLRITRMGGAVIKTWTDENGNERTSYRKQSHNS